MEKNMKKNIFMCNRVTLLHRNNLIPQCIINYTSKKKKKKRKGEEKRKGT